MVARNLLPTLSPAALASTVRSGSTLRITEHFTCNLCGPTTRVGRLLVAIVQGCA
jgi:hypothetical protein